ncbi:PDZ domain-containing protein [Streptomyces albus subsp. chlorinus]|uniref:S41 family peptidase n=1 Tax=Streptomyces albus TaxID=1888 RepID=UPI00156D4C62|nr:S41 family peptidase [Streptomyces albus]NSC22000.1 PDZ domain-containing protein [Streptomyces albus subsp. chlorinus]
MPGSWFPDTRPRRSRRGALTLVFAGVLATGAATGAFGDELTAFGSAAPDASAHRPQDAALGTGRGDDAKGARPDPRGARGRGAGGADADLVVSRSGDRWSTAYTAREYEGLRQALDGSYVGVGLSVRQGPAHGGGHQGARGGRGAAIEVDRVQPGSPAARAGLRSGDRLRSVAGRRVTGRPVTAVVALLRGSDPRSPAGAAEPGTRVTLRLTRGGTELTRTLRRERLSTESVAVDRLGDDVTRIKVGSFTRGSGERVREAVREEVPAGAGVLLDLRGNSGGLVGEAVTAASAFLDGGLVATYDDHGTQRALYADDDRPGGLDVGRHPVVVLVDGGTMSAAELLTGALQDRGRAVVVGSRTFGKGSVQLPQPQSDGSVAELTVGHYTTPAGRDVEGHGIAPDLPVRGARASVERARTVLSGLEARS